MEEWAQQQGIDLSGYRHHAIITPLGQRQFMGSGTGSCQWTGQAVIGPFSGTYGAGGYSYVWINGEYWRSPQGWFHEIGHNYFLGHAAVPQVSPTPRRVCQRRQGWRWGAEPCTACAPTRDPRTQATPYSDFSCAMGFCCKPRCMNPPHNWQLGWGNEVDPNRDPIAAGETRMYILPAQNLGPRHVVSKA